jgi:hypothetical protein
MMRTANRRSNGEGGGAAAAAAPLVNGKPETPAADAKSKPPIWEFLQDEERDTDGTDTWLYRLKPVIDRKQGEHCICRKKGRFTRDEILREFGSGVYQLQVNDSRGKSLYKDQISFHNLDFPPRVDPLEVVVGDPRNDIYFATWAKKSAGGEQGNSRASAKGETAEILNAVLERGGKVDPALIELWKEASTQRDELAKLLAEKNAAPAYQPGAAPDLLSILTQVKGLQTDPLTMIEKLKGFFPAAKEQPRQEPPPQTNSIDELKKVLDVFEQAKGIFKTEAPAAAAGPGPDAELWERIAVNVSSQAAPLLNALGGIILAFKSKTPGAQPAPGPSVAPAAAPVAFDPYKDAAAMRNFASSQRGAGAPAATPSPAEAGSVPQAAPGEAAATATPPLAQPTDDPIAAQIIAMMNQALSCLNRGIDGHTCAQAMIDLNGELLFDSLAQRIQGAGIPVVIELAKGIPEIADQVTAYEQPLKQFIEEFLQGPAEYEESEEKPAV